jgi:cell division protein FtsW
VIALFITLLWLGWRAIQAAVTDFGRLLALGITFLLGMQALINIAVVTVCAPTKGISLPFVSAGGSGVIILGIAAGLLVSVAREPELDCGSEWVRENESLLGLAT